MERDGTVIKGKRWDKRRAQAGTRIQDGTDKGGWGPGNYSKDQMWLE